MAIIRQVFADEIKTKRPPNKETADIILEEHKEDFTGKSTKDIYDKVRNEYRHKAEN